MKQSQSFKVGIYLQIQLHHQRIRAQCCPWGKTAWTGHTLSWQAEPPFFLTRSPSNWKLFPPECWWLQRRGIFLASLQNLGNCGLLGLHLPSSRAGCKQTIMNCKYWVFRSLTCSAQFIFFIKNLFSLIEVQQSPLWLEGPLFCCRLAPIFCDYSSTIFTAERVPWYQFLICQINGEYPPLITTLLKLQHSLLPVSAAACCSCCSARRSCGICLRRSGWN